MRDDAARLRDMLEAIDRINLYATDSNLPQEVLDTWIVHHLQILGEAARGISDTVRLKLPTVPWRQIIAMRNILVHNYFGIDHEAVAQVVRQDLPQLRLAITHALEQFP